MKLNEAVKSIGIGWYPQELDEIWRNLWDDPSPACDLAYIDQLQEDYDTFGEYYTLVRETAEKINSDPLRSTWVKTGIAYGKDRPFREVNNLSAPKQDGTAVSDLLPLYILIGLAPAGIEQLRNRGFSEIEIGRLMHRFWDALDINRILFGRPAINNRYFGWLTRFVKARIFEMEVLQIELSNAPKGAIYLRHKVSGNIVPFVDSGMVHRTGQQMLGSAGFEDEDGAFEAKFYEDEENFYGHGCFDCVIDSELKAYPKTQWEVYLRPGDEMLSFHIPRGSDISPETVRQQFELGKKLVRERFPEHKGFDIHGSTWLFDPTLNELVRPESKISQLMKLFCRYPLKSDGNEIFYFVFDGRPADLNTLPEDSSLRRGLKKMYLEGRYNHLYAGIVTQL